MPDENGWIDPADALPDDRRIIDAHCLMSDGDPWISCGSRFMREDGLPAYVTH